MIMYVTPEVNVFLIRIRALTLHAIQKRAKMNVYCSFL